MDPTLFDGINVVIAYSPHTVVAGAEVPTAKESNKESRSAAAVAIGI